MSRCIRCSCDKEDIAFYCYSCRQDVEEVRKEIMIKIIKGEKLMNRSDALKKIEELKLFIANSDKEIIWIRIGDLEWSENLGEMNWDEAQAKSKELGARLPERWEMVKAVDEHKDEMQELTKSDDSYCFWSATEYSATSAWYVNLYNGTTFNNTKSTNTNQVRCVR